MGTLAGFNVGISGLNASARAIGVVSTNISNANTVGYKAAEYLFVDQYFRALTSTEVGRVAQGVSETAVRRQFSQGAIRTSGNPLDLAINGAGLFKLSSGTGEEPGLVYYTRNGQLSVDKDGYIVNASGLYVRGRGPNIRGDGVTNAEVALRIPSAIKNAVETTEAALSLNLDARTEVKKAVGAGVGDPPKNFDPEDDSTYAHTTAFTIFDPSGNRSTVKAYFRRVLDGTETVEGNSVPVEKYKIYASVTDVFGVTSWIKDQGGNLVTVSDAPKGADPDTTTEAYNIMSQFATTVDGKNLDGTLNFFGGENTRSIGRDSKTGVPLNPTKIDFSVRTSVNDAITGAGTYDQKVTLDLSEITRFSSDFEVVGLSQNGFPKGALNSVAFDENGVLYGIYSSGQRVVAGRAILTQFKNPEGLSPVAQNLFAQTVASGEPLEGVPGEGSNGVVRNASLEEANLDMASELVNLMVQQRNYQANSESIRAQDEILKNTIALSR